MLQYLINASAIWLISLVLFDAFLRRESYHNYNRFYLLFTFLLGALLPLWQWQDNSSPFSGTFQKPIEQVIAAKQTIVSATTQAATSIDWQQWLLVIYLIGVFAALCLLIIDSIRLLAYYRKGKKSIQYGWTIIQTGKEHAPFSFMNTLFVGSIKQYSPEEWNMILAHEKRHTTLLHFADLLLMQVARIIFWFHPLVYLYNNRLLLVHEYQADNASAQQLQVYGTFLVEQALLQSAPSLSHSFNRSPIKNRIVMLTHRSSAASRTRMLVFIPLALVCIICFSKNSFSQRFERNGNTVTYRGNTFELSDAKYDTTSYLDPVTGKWHTTIIETTPAPITMNGKPIAKDVDQKPVFTGSDKDLRDYLLKNMKGELGKLNDGLYTLNISNIFVDENGRIVYFDYDNMKRSKTLNEAEDPVQHVSTSTAAASDPPIQVTLGGQNYALNRNTDPDYYEQISKNNQLEIYNKVCLLMETAPAFEPATIAGRNAISDYFCVSFRNHFQIKNHKVYDVDKNGAYKEM